MRWLFPENKKAEAASKLDQALKVKEEGGEVFSAVLDNESDMRVLEETWDAIQAAEGLLRKFPVSKVMAAKARVIVKCTKRGDYR